MLIGLETGNKKRSGTLLCNKQVNHSSMYRYEYRSKRARGAARREGRG